MRDGGRQTAARRGVSASPLDLGPSNKLRYAGCLMTQTGYQPGVCNIGAEEIRRRLNAGWIGLLVTLIGYAVLVASGVSPWWRLLLFFPAAASASGFIQARLKFCAGFARRGIFNFGNLGKANHVVDEEAMAMDRRRGNQIAIYSSLIGTSRRDRQRLRAAVGQPHRSADQPRVRSRDGTESG